jgi:hypothetical protein
MRSPATEVVGMAKSWALSFSSNVGPSGAMGVIGVICVISVISGIGVTGLRTPSISLVLSIGASLPFGFFLCVIE